MLHLWRDFGHQRDYSESITGVVDREIRNYWHAHQEAFDILVANRKILDEMVLEPSIKRRHGMRLQRFLRK